MGLEADEVGSTTPAKTSMPRRGTSCPHTEPKERHSANLSSLVEAEVGSEEDSDHKTPMRAISEREEDSTAAKRDR